MLTSLQLLLLVFISGILLYTRVAIWASLLVLAAFFLGATYFQTLPLLLLVPLWGLFLVFAVLFAIPPLSRHLLSRPAFAILKKAVPPMSNTEREAMEAGDVWWEGELFQGRPNWQRFLAMEPDSLTEEEQAFLDNQTETLCGMIDDWSIVEEHQAIPDSVMDYIKSQKFNGMVIPKEYGGLGFSALAHSAIIIKMASRSVSASVTAMVPNSLGPAELLLAHGTEAQKNHYLPRLATGEEMPCFALTGTHSGSDASAMPDYGIVCEGEYEGETVLGMKLTFDKRYITLAPIATVVGLAFKLYDPDHLLGHKESLGITLALIPRSTPGLDMSAKHNPLGMAFMNGTVRGSEVFVPLDTIIGGPQKAGQGWAMLMDCLSVGRAISLPALGTANAKLCYAMTRIYANVREQFNVPIGHFEGIEAVLARMAGYTYLIEATRILSVYAVDQGIKPSVVSAIAKCHLTEFSRVVINDAMDVHGGRAIQYGPRNYLAHAYQSIPMGITVEGANILTRNLVIFGQGAIRCHPFIHREMELARAEHTKENLKQFDAVIKQHVGYTASNGVRALWQGLTGGHFMMIKGNLQFAQYYRQVTRMSMALALVADVAMLLLGGQLKRKERLSARLGDVLSYLYMGSAVLKHHKNAGSPGDEVAFVKWSLETCLLECQNALIGFCDNFPVPWVGPILKRAVFPWGKSYKGPTDGLEKVVARKMLSDAQLNDRLCEHLYIGKSADDVTGRMAHVFAVWQEHHKIFMHFKHLKRHHEFPEPLTLEEQIDYAVQQGWLTADDAEKLKILEAARLDALQVDEFPVNNLNESKVVV